jgi:hypothetical protein
MSLAVEPRKIMAHVLEVAGDSLEQIEEIDHEEGV